MRVLIGVGNIVVHTRSAKPHNFREDNYWLICVQLVMTEKPYIQRIKEERKIYCPGVKEINKNLLP